MFNKIKLFLKKLNYLLTADDKKMLFILLIMGFVLSIIETVGISAIMPFISLASNPDLIDTNDYYKLVYEFFSFSSSKEFIIYFGVSLICFYIFRSLYTIYYSYLSTRFSMGKYSDFTTRLFKNYINMPYYEYVNRNSATMTKVIFSESMQLSLLVQNLLQFISEILVIIVLYILLLIVDINMTLILTFILGVKIILLLLTISKRIKIKGKDRAVILDKFYRMINEAFGNFKIIKFISNQDTILNNVNKMSSNFSKIYVVNNTLQQVPRNVLEAVGLSLLMSVVIYIVSTDSDVSSVIPIVSMYALALYRILPAVSRILSSYNNIMFGFASLDIVYNDISYEYEHEHEKSHIEFNNKININQVSFSYNQETTILKNIILEIHKGQKVAFIGESGSGKSTLVDIICGVYKANSGKVLIDGIELNNSNVVSWRKKIGYIPQSIYLFDATISDNITFGREYNERQLIKVLKQANIYDTLMEKDGLDTLVGEGGIQLSGGQKQRIGIARALYGNPEVLVLDEATSALDTATETAIMDEIYKVSEDKTLIVIAHRLSTIERCDIKIDLGKLNK